MVSIKAWQNGPYLIEGDNMTVLDWNGNAYQIQGGPFALCRCGGSAKKPFCDGTHSTGCRQVAECQRSARVSRLREYGMRSDPLPQGTGRVILRRLTPADLVRFQAYRHDADVGLYQGWEPEPDQVAIQFLEDMSDIHSFPLGAWIQLGIADQQTNDLVGDVGVRVSEDGKEAEIGFSLAREAQGFGLGTEAVRELIELIFTQTDVGKLVASTDERNTRAHRLLMRTGFRKARTTCGLFRGQPCIEHVWEISRPEKAG